MRLDFYYLVYLSLFRVAVASGGDETKRMADDVTAAVNDDGVFKALKKYGLI